MKPVIRKGLELSGQDLINNLQRSSPVQEGLLKQWFFAEKGDTQVKIQSPARYARWVNDGHSQQPGRYIPGSWNGDRFKYNPKSKTGMVLKKSFVPGQHFVEKGMKQTEARIEEFFKIAISEELG